MKSWFIGLSRAGKIGVVLASLAVGGVAARAGNPQTKTSPPPPQPQKVVVETKTTTETQSIPFKKTSVNDGSLAKGKTHVRTAGVNGVKTLTYEITTTNGTQTNKKLVKEEITKASVAQVTVVGTYVYVAPPVYVAPKSSCDPNYSPCIPNTSGNALNCPDIGIMVRVIGVDHNRFDADGDGYGCESYQ